MEPSSAGADPTWVPCSGAAQVKAVDSMNAKGGGVVTLTPHCTYKLSAAFGPDHGHGADGLPLITTVVTLEGSANVITRTGKAKFRIVEIGNGGDLTLKSITINNGDASGAAPSGAGGGILNFDALTLTGSAVTGNHADGAGGGIESIDGSAAVTLTSSTVSHNSAGGDGGGVDNFGSATVTHSVIARNTSGGRGGGISSVLGIFTLTSTSVSANTAAASAGGLFRQGGTVTVTTSTINSNTPNNCGVSSPVVPHCVG